MSDEEKRLEGFDLSERARSQLQQRRIEFIWLTETRLNPDRLVALADAQGNTHSLKQILDFGDRWLRVIVNPTVDPPRIVTVFFDRRVQ